MTQRRAGTLAIPSQLDVVVVSSKQSGLQGVCTLVVERTRGVNTPRSTSLIRSPFLGLFMSPVDGGEVC